MKTKIHSQSGIFNPRILVAFALGSVGVLLAMLTFAAAPASSMALSATGPAPAWSIVPSPNASTTQDNSLDGVTCTSASDCWAVGSHITGGNFFYPLGQTLIEHWNGAAWSIVPSPNTSTTQNNSLSGVTCASASDCWAVGSYVISTGPFSGFYYRTLIEHWNGAAWSIVPSPNASTKQDNQLRGVTCTSASNCWAVGQYNTNFSSPHTLVEHWNGAAWSIVLTNITQENVPFGITCPSASDCWAVGYWGTTDNIFHTFVAHWNGAAWSFVTSPNTSTTQPNRLDGVTCSSASDCWAVGGYWDDANVSHTLTEHWDGAAWSIVTSPNTSATEHNRLDGVTCTSASDCWAVGYTFFDIPGGNNVIQTLVEHWNGAAWSIVTSPNRTIPTPYDSLYGVTCTSASDCWAVGSYFGDNAYQTLIERYTPTPTLMNISTRLKVLTGDNVLIGGLIIGGSDSMTVLFRALGPTLSGFNVPGVLADPTLELHTTDNMGHDVVVGTNDNWKVDDQTHQSQRAAITATGKAPSFDSEAAILRTLAPGNYTVIVRGKNSGTGVALVEAYDVSTGANSEFINISSRGFVDTNANVMIGGFIVGSPSNFLVRALGPTLGAPPFNIPGAMTDPTLELHTTDNTGHDVVVATNDNWKVDDQTQQSQQAAIMATGKAPTHDSEAAILRTLAPGNYTAILKGKNNTTGIALLEVYNVP